MNGDNWPAIAKKSCDFPGCERPRRDSPLCRRHRIQRDSGEEMTPLPMIATSAHSLEERMRLRTERTEACWNWTGAKDANGYGQIRYVKMFRAHRVAWELANGPIPEGMVIDHKCHNKACVNPEHLQVVTQKENSENLRPTKNNELGVRGVRWDKKVRKYEARVGHNYTSHVAGYYDSLDAAEQAVIALRNRLHTNNLSDRVGA